MLFHTGITEKVDLDGRYIPFASSSRCLSIIVPRIFTGPVVTSPGSGREERKPKLIVS